VSVSATVRKGEGPRRPRAPRWQAMLDEARRAWETAPDDVERARHQLSALALCSPLTPGTDYRVPQWLYKALCDQQAARLRQVEPDMHWLRWMMVWEGKRQKRPGSSEKLRPWPGAYQYASEKLAGTPYEGGPDAMKRSHHIVQRILRKHGY
jgi:hypothetical protein